MTTYVLKYTCRSRARTAQENNRGRYSFLCVCVCAWKLVGRAVLQSNKSNEEILSPRSHTIDCATENACLATHEWSPQRRFTRGSTGPADA